MASPSEKTDHAGGRRADSPVTHEAPPNDGKKEEEPRYSISSHDSAASTTYSREGSPPPAPSLCRSVSEVRDGIPYQRAMEEGRLGPAKAIKHEREDKVSAGPDENLVAWDGSDDPENPKNWLLKKKWAAVVTVSFFTLVSPVSSTMAAPALPNIGESLGITSDLQLNLTLSIFVAAYAVGPLLWGPLSEVYGRVIILQISNLWFLCFNIGCALAQNEPTMAVMRFLAGIGGSAPMAAGGGVLSDLFTPEQRGRAISIYSVAPLLGPAIGPIAGGWIAELSTWRWCFYSTSIACGVIQLGAWFFLRESYAPLILERKKKQLIKETGNERLYTEYDNPERTLTQTLTRALTRPFRLLFTQPIVIFLATYLTYLYGTMYLLLTTFPGLFKTVYNESPGIQGLNYISIGAGFFIGTQVCAPLQDRIYIRLKKKYLAEGEPGVPEFRVPMMIPGALLVPAGLLIYAWTAEAKTHWIGPNLGAAIFGAGLIIGYQCIQGYLVDTYARYAASAVGAATVLRSLAGFGFPLFAPKMYDTLGYGKGGTVLAVVAIVLGFPAPVVLWRYGAKMRAKSKFTR